jgi:hypothetical protein
MHPDLSQFFNTEEDFIYHYINYGFQENRPYKLPDDFNWETYRLMNPDLHKFSKKERLINHYINYGFQENRPYKNININDELFPFDNFYKENSQLLYTKQETSTDFSTIHSDDIIITRKFGSNNFLKYKATNDILYSFKDFILVLDFHNAGGGTTFFLNTIVSKYKFNQTFVIARNYNGYIHLNINDETELITKYNLEESLVFVDNFKERISKIFINHLLNHDRIFIQKINTLEIEIINITHDYYNICNYPQPFFHNIQHEVRSEPLIRNDILITQNEINLYTFNNQYKQLLILELPDYKNTNELIQYDNRSDIIIAIIGSIGEIKGKRILEKLIAYYKNTNVKIIVLGHTTIVNFYNCYGYKNIHELNNLLIKYKPNIIIELSLWPETYSYTLTLSMITQLPIIYLKKKFNSVIEDRLKKYNNAFSFTNIKEFNELIYKYKQNYLYTISPIIYYNKEWDNIFSRK